MFGVLDRYIGRTILHAIAMTLFILISLSGMIKFVEQLRKVGQGEYSVLSAGLYTLLNVPSDIETFFPMAALLGALLGLGALAANSELIVMQASGFTRIKIAASVMKTTIPLVVLIMAISEWGAPQGELMARKYRAQMIYNDSLLSTQSGLWAKDGPDFIFIQQVLGDKELAGVNIYHFDQQNHLLSVRHAAAATFEDDRWKLHQVDESDLSSREQIRGTQTLNSEWKTSLTPDKLGVVAGSPDSLSISGLYHYIKYLKQSGQESSRYQLNLWRKVLSPLSVAVMMLMALSFIFGPLRTVPMGIRIVTGISFGFVFYVLDQIFGPLSLVYHLPPVVGALLPSLFFLLISIYMLLKRR